MKAVEILEVSKSHGKQRVLDSVSLEIQEGERMVILGPSGCGKTTLLRLIAGFMPPDRGKILLRGKGVSQGNRILVPPEKRKVGMVFQDLALWPHLTVRGHLEFVFKVRGIPREERENRLEELLHMVDLSFCQTKKPHELSGGEKQRLALVRALAGEPTVLLMDEPLSSLDEDLNRRMRKEIVQLQERLAFTLLYVTHNREEAREIATRIVFMKEGRILENPGG